MTKALDTLYVVTLSLALAGAIAGTVTAAAVLHGETDRVTMDQAHAQAVALLRAQRYAAAYGRLAKLGDAGHAPSAEVALLMLRNGRELFGAEWSASLAQQRRWAELAFSCSVSGPCVRDNGAGD